MIDRREVVDIQEMLSLMRSMVGSRGGLVKEVCADLEVEAIVELAVQPRSTVTPDLWLPPDFVQWVNDMGAAIDIDVMLWAEEEITGN